MTKTVPQDDLAPVWRALADPCRRRMLDLLRQRPHTTGELVAAFSFTRFATMKHLKVLHGAGLITVERRSRERINHLNPVPIQQIYRRFVRPFEADHADSLLRLKAVAEEGEPTMTESNEHPFRMNDIRLEVRINAPVAKVWAALTEDIGRWWPKAFCVGEARAFTLEARVGGRMFEDWGDGEGLLWGTVNTLRRHKQLDVAGDGFPDFGGASRHLNSYTLEDRGEATLLKLRSVAIGALSEQSKSDLESGWRLLFEQTMPAYLEGRPLPGPAVMMG